MSQNISQIYTNNPAVAMQSSDLLYLGRSPYNAGDDFAITWNNMQNSISGLGTITSGTWNGAIINPIYGGTGINNGTSTITLDGSFSMAGAYTFSGTLTGNTTVTYPTSGTLATTAQLPTPSAMTQVSDTNVTITLVGTPSTSLLQPVAIEAGWSGTLSPSRGGTGINNGSSTLTYGGNTTFSGAYTFVGSLTGATSVTFPTSGTLATTSQLPSGAALTEVNDTNVTLTLGGTPNTALLQATSITAGWTGTLSPARGGTGVNNGTSTLTMGGNQAFSGAYTGTYTLTNNTAVTFPTSGTLATTSQIPTGAALTEVNDTNVTLTLGGSASTSLVNAASITAGWAGTLAVARGGTGVGSVTTAPTASSWAGWDANYNLSANNFIQGYATTVTSSGTTTLTVASAENQYFTGSTTGQIILMPVTSTLVLGQRFTIANNSSAVITVKSSGSNTIQAMAANTQLVLTCILTSGTTAASWSSLYIIDAGITTPVSLANGGTGAALTASNGGIFYSNASTGAILSGTATANQLLLSGASTAPLWSTTTYPTTNAINTLLYASSANTMAALATGNNGVLTTSAGGVPSISSTLPTAVQGNITSTGTISSGTWNGGVIVGTYGGTGVNNGSSTITVGGNTTFSGAYTFTGTLTGNTSVTFPTSGTLATTANAGLNWVAAPSTPVAMVATTGYIITDASQVTLTLPATAAVGTLAAVVGFGAGGWILKPNSGQTISINGVSASTSITSGGATDCIEVICVVANTTWMTRSYVTAANLTYA